VNPQPVNKPGDHDALYQELIEAITDLYPIFKGPHPTLALVLTDGNRGRLDAITAIRALALTSQPVSAAQIVSAPIGRKILRDLERATAALLTEIQDALAAPAITEGTGPP
jgi:hypothetical protein